MTILDWVVMILMGLTLILVLLTFFSLITTIEKNNDLQHLKQKKLKSRKRHSLNKRVTQKEGERTKLVIRSITFLIAGIFTMTGSLYVYYYQSTRLNQTDQTSIALGYYYLNMLEQELSIVEQTGERATTAINLDTLGTRLSAFALIVADSHLDSEAQIALNQYYNHIKELGLNLSGQPQQFYANPQSLAAVTSDLKKVRQIEKAMLLTFKVDESNFSESF